jgi:hypothetical protein
MRKKVRLSQAIQIMRPSREELGTFVPSNTQLACSFGRPSRSLLVEGLSSISPGWAIREAFYCIQVSELASAVVTLPCGPGPGLE